MNKQELIDVLVKDKASGIDSKAAAGRAIDAILDAIKKGIAKDGSVALVGFGTFAVKARKARKGRNPATGEQITIKASKSVSFKAGSDLKASAAKCKAGKK